MAPEVRLVDALTATSRELCALAGGDACAISRKVGDVLILFAEHTPDGTLQLGQGFLISDFPVTEAVLRDGLAYRVTVDDPGADPAEMTLVRALGYGAMLMVALGDPPEPWGLVEIYRTTATPFVDGDVQAVREALARTAARLPAP